MVQNSPKPSKKINYHCHSLLHLQLIQRTSCRKSTGICFPSHPWAAEILPSECWCRSPRYQATSWPVPSPGLCREGGYSRPTLNCPAQHLDWLEKMQGASLHHGTNTYHPVKFIIIKVRFLQARTHALTSIILSTMLYMYANDYSYSKLFCSIISKNSLPPDTIKQHLFLFAWQI